MTARFIEGLFARIVHASPRKISEHLNRMNMPWLPHLTHAGGPANAVHQICRTLVASASVPVCLERIASLCCWLMATQRICPWLLLRFGAGVLEVDHSALLRDLVVILQIICRHTVIRSWNISGSYYTCVINNYRDPNSQESQISATFFVLWPGQRFAAAFARTHQELLALTTALYFAMRGESVELLLGFHADLGSAYAAGLQGVGGASLFRSTSSTNPLVQQFWYTYGQGPAVHRSSDT
ncbi:hypothetical protein MTO96_041799 [Rhipicephalus appendiculatus]